MSLPFSSVQEWKDPAWNRPCACLEDRKTLAIRIPNRISDWLYDMKESDQVHWHWAWTIIYVCDERQTYSFRWEKFFITNHTLVHAIVLQVQVFSCTGPAFRDKNGIDQITWFQRLHIEIAKVDLLFGPLLLCNLILEGRQFFPQLVSVRLEGRRRWTNRVFAGRHFQLVFRSNFWATEIQSLSLRTDERLTDQGSGFDSSVFERGTST